jgi:hypothetical protein
MIINPDRFSSMFDTPIEVVVTHYGYYFISLSFLILFFKRVTDQYSSMYKADCERGKVKQVNSERLV